MNRNQKCILMLGLIIFFVMCLVPPWYYEITEFSSRRTRPTRTRRIRTRPTRQTRTRRGISGLKTTFTYTRPGSYYPVFYPPSKHTYLHIDKDRLHIQLLIITVLTGGLMAVAISKNKQEQKSTDREKP